MQNYGPHSEIDICLCDDCGFARYVCNDCKCSHKNLREFKCVQCSIKNLCGRYDHECDYLHGSPDDEYDSSQKHDLYLEHDAIPDNYFVDGATRSAIKTDDNYSAMAKAAEANDVIEKTSWGNDSSMDYFLMENQNKHTGIQSVVSNATKHNKLTLCDIDYHLLGTLLCNSLPRKKIRLLELLLNETLPRFQQEKPLILCHHDIRRCYTKGKKSIYMNMPVPYAIVSGEAFGNFAIVSVENAVNHLLGHGILQNGTQNRASQEIFAKCSARIALGYWGKKLYQFHYMYLKYLSYKRKISSIREIETFSL